MEKEAKIQSVTKSPLRLIWTRGEGERGASAAASGTSGGPGPPSEAESQLQVMLPRLPAAFASCSESQVFLGDFEVFLLSTQVQKKKGGLVECQWRCN